MSWTPGDTGYEPRGAPGPRTLLKRLREIMAAQTAPQARLNDLVTSIATNMVANVCSIYVRRADDMLELFATQGLNPGAVHNTRLSMEEGLVGWVARHRRHLNVSDAKAHEAFAYREETDEDPYNAFLGIPIIRSGQVLGVLVIQSAAQRRFSDEEVDVAQTVATVLAEIVSSGGLLEEQDRRDVQALLHKPESAHGTAIVPGIAQGVVVRREPEVRAHPTFATDVAAEKLRLNDAVASVQRSVDDMIAADKSLFGASKEVLEVFRLFAYDKGWVRRLDEKVLSGLTAETAVEQVQEENRKRMRSVSDPYLRERLHDLDDLSRRLLRALDGEQQELGDLPEGAILLAETLGPVELLEFGASVLRGLVLGDGAATSHAAIVARALDIPMISGVHEIVDKAATGDVIALDGSTGEVHLRPPETVLKAFRDRGQLRTKTLARYEALKDAPTVTKDGVAVDLQMNAGLLLDMTHMDETGVKSVGLFRTELQFLLGRSLPTAADQQAFYTSVMDAAATRTVVFRTADIGSDKRAGYMKGPHEANPAMGWRGLRVSIDREGLMRTQMRALLAAAGDRPLHIMLPLVTTVGEVRQAKSVIAKEMVRHERHVGALPPKVEIGAMIEIPSAAWDARAIAQECDFLSIGGNDLAQFFFAADRETDEVSGRYDPLMPSFLTFLERTIREGKAGGASVGYCGEQAADPLMALALLAVGIDRLSVAASAIGPLREMIRSVNFEDLRENMAGMFAGGGGSLRLQLRAYADQVGIVLPK